MNRLTTIFLLLVCVAASFAASAQAPAERKSNFLAALKENQQVTLKETNGRYEISIVEGVAAVQGHKVTEIGPDYIVVQDIAGVTELHIPLFSVKAIIRLKMPTP